MHLEKKDVVAVVVVVVPSLAQDLRVPCCPGCRQSGDGRAKEGTGDCSAGDRVAGPSMTAWQHPQLEEMKPPSALTRPEGVQRSQAESAQSRAQRSDGELQIKPWGQSLLDGIPDSHPAPHLWSLTTSPHTRVAPRSCLGPASWFLCSRNISFLKHFLAALCLKNKTYKINLCSNIEIWQHHSAQGRLVINTSTHSSDPTFP